MRLLLGLLLTLLALPRLAAADGRDDRAYTVSVLTRIAEPVLMAGSEGRLIATLAKEGGKLSSDTAPLEALGRTLAGIAPWLELGPDDTPEGQARARCLALALGALRNGCNPASADRVDFRHPVKQPIVDAAYLAHALLRSKTQLWGGLKPEEQAYVIAALKETKALKPWNNNWLLFSGLIEATIWDLTGSCDMAPIDLAVSSFEKWYLGDGTYGDGQDYHWDWYNSFVIHPMYLAILEVCARKQHAHGALLEKARKRAARYAEVQERMISPEGTFPVLGRSSTYRFAAFHHLADTALRGTLPKSLDPGATRAALTAVIRRMTEAPGTFTSSGWLTLGAVGAQPAMRDPYNSVASPYIALCGLLHLGLPANHPFWTAPAAKWTQQRIWAGEDVARDAYMK